MVTEKLIAIVKELRKKGYSYGQISNLLGIAKSTAWYAVNNPGWLKEKGERFEEWKKKRELSEYKLEAESRSEMNYIVEVIKDISQKREEVVKRQLYELFMIKEILKADEKEMKEKENRFWKNLIVFLLIKNWRF
jgi:orotate phosphoribosyltransferase-like protein